MAPIDTSEPQVVTSATFDASDADVVFRSSDGMLFRIHRKNLDFASDGFPPAEFPLDDWQIVDLSEDSETLELMFRFVYPRLLPSMKGVDFKSLAAVAEAVEKYQIYMGMHVCNTYMSQTVPSPENAITILDYAIKHGYPELANRVAPSVSLPGISHGIAIDVVSPELLRLWVPYYNNLAEAIRLVTDKYREPYTTHTDDWGVICSAWAGHHKNILDCLSNIAGVRNDMTIPLLVTVPHGAKRCCVERAIDWRNELTKTLDGIPPFVRPS
ncbi:hypothetical protein FPV67DRAFT_1481333 [Lyophyllum atratum]|nr:hypothetical protein FPV67DRAFT_1481333 [Lyophyllum atratum]